MRPLSVRRIGFGLLLVLLFVLVGAAAGARLALDLTVTHWVVTSPRAFSAEMPLAIPSLQALGGAQDAAAYFNANADALALLFGERDPARLAGLYAMYEIHTSHRYGTPERYPEHFQDWLREPLAHCGTYARFEALLMRSLGLTTRIVVISGSTHAWVEAWIDGRWEVFDATVNTWIDHSGSELMAGVSRRYRAFYTPLLDPAFAPEDGWLRESAKDLRAAMPLLGVGWYPKAVIQVQESS